MARSSKARKILTAAAGAVAFSSAAYASSPTLSTYYAAGEIAQNLNFTLDTQSVTLSNTSPKVYLPLGDYFEFGLSLDLSNNPNSTANIAAGQPSWLGLGFVNYVVTSSDANATFLQPLLSSTQISGNEYESTAVFTNTTPSLEQQGDVEVGSGTVGANQAIAEGDFTVPTGTTTAGMQRLALWAGSTVNPANATGYFIDLGYKALAAGVVDLNPGVEDNGNGTDYYAPGGSTFQNPYGYQLIDLATSTATIAAIPSLVVTIEPSVTWDGDTNHTTWNTSTGNWSYNGNTTADYSNPDFVTFDDTAPSNSTSISLSTTVSPDLVTVNSNTNNFTISGSGSIGGSAAIVKNGTSTFTVSTSNSFTGGITVNAGTLIANASNALSTNNALTINNAAKVKLASSTGLATLSALSITANGTFDITNNHVIINYGSSDPKATILQYLASGSDGGLWTGPGITSSTAAANPAYGVAFADGADGVVSSLSSGQIELKYTLYGDIDLTGTVDVADFGILAANFNKGVSNGWEQGDFLYQGTVDVTDFQLLAENFNKGAVGTDSDAVLVSFAQANELMADLPEPASLGLIALGGIGFLRRTRPRR